MNTLTRSDPLFSRKGDLKDFLESRKNELKKEVERYNPNYILNVNEEKLCQYLVSKYSLEPLKIYEDKIYALEPKEADVDISIDKGRPHYVKGTQITIVIPFEGDKELFQYKPPTYNFIPIHGKIVNQEIHLILEIDQQDERKIKQMYELNLNKIKMYLDYINNAVNHFNKELEPIVKDLVSQRKRRLLKDMDLISSLGIPIKRRDNIPNTYAIPSIRKKLKFEPPKASKEPPAPEPYLAQEEYENILKMIHNMALMMERSPKTFSKLTEKEIRDHFLMMLNANYEGQATGETFNYGGKTDILIRYKNKNVFIAECKFWRGEKKLIEAIDQLLRYTSWRDTKTAILLFNKNKNFSSILGKIDHAVKSHRCYKRKFSLKSNKLMGTKTIFSYIFHQPMDIDREIILTIMAFNVPK